VRIQPHGLKTKRKKRRKKFRKIRPSQMRLRKMAQTISQRLSVRMKTVATVKSMMLNTQRNQMTPMRSKRRSRSWKTKTLTKKMTKTIPGPTLRQLDVPAGRQASHAILAAAPRVPVGHRRRRVSHSCWISLIIAKMMSLLRQTG